MLTASTSYRTKDENDRLVGDVSVICCGGVNPIGGDGWDDAIVSHNKRQPRAVCQNYKILQLAVK